VLKNAGVMVSILIKGALTQAMANEPHIEWGEGRFTPTFPRLMKLLPVAYPPLESDPGDPEHPGALEHHCARGQLPA
jgi:hypothetical protein